MYILGLTFTALFSWGGFFLVVTQLDPEEFVGSMPYVAFFATLFLAVTATASIISFYVRVLLSKNQVYYGNLNISLREGFFVAVLITTFLSLQYFRVLTFLDAGLLIASMILFEIFLLSRKRKE